jgi:hypothetical protein
MKILSSRRISSSDVRVISSIMATIIDIAQQIVATRFPRAVAAFAAGSLVRGDGTAYSDLDLVVVLPQLDSAYRESFLHNALPVEAFVHDPHTLHYFFFEIDRPSGIPALPQMVLEGVEIPGPTTESQSLKRLARSVIDAGPPPLTHDALTRRRYALTDILDDIRAPRSYAELVATGSQLFETLADLYFRSSGRWSARGKSIPRKLAAADGKIARLYDVAFEALFRESNPQLAIALAEEILASAGGLLFDGHRLDAPAAWREGATKKT